MRGFFVDEGSPERIHPYGCSMMRTNEHTNERMFKSDWYLTVIVLAQCCQKDNFF